MSTHSVDAPGSVWSFLRPMTQLRRPTRDDGYGFLDSAVELPGVVSVAMRGAERRCRHGFSFPWGLEADYREREELGVPNWGLEKTFPLWGGVPNILLFTLEVVPRGSIHISPGFSWVKTSVSWCH